MRSWRVLPVHAGVLHCCVDIMGVSSCGRKPGLELDVDMLAPGYNARQLQQLKVYIAHLFVSRVTVYMSFLPAEWRHSRGANERPRIQYVRDQLRSRLRNARRYS